ncbi:PHP domain protein [Cellulomonas flavigena DSM 20109]|uniref:PHP domain protein n=1 Tax=Cellulomonas flavigena (strain ATCC 482 / DSM 20109 / BCRC 11376 / JCM 18109 / NBRC 3775 / NCIMB 8073 / NRS 134) TaxID=446466 RepID=D5UI23_CELFN|nr:PHP domain-containing protein [Cellulomonas flavigena]ADG75368.1 PHP domain protein [Cellulomonas flavigena DSM 20109]
MRIDLHTHSRASDGTQAPAVLVAAARDAGLDVVALTDHDTTAGWDEAAAAALDVGIALVRGTEVSARSRGVSVHLLSYLQDPEHPALAGELARAAESRVTRARSIVELLARDVPITWQDVLDQARDAVVVGRPHIADALVARGVVPDRDAAFAHLLRSDGPYHVDHYAPAAPVAVAAIRASGGVPVFAHPAADARGRIVPDDVFDELAEAGLAGLEVHHRDHSPAQRERLLAIAERLGLIVTGSSDYHGAGKLNRLGENLTDPQVLEEIVRQGATEVVGA